MRLILKVTINWQRNVWWHMIITIMTAKHVKIVPFIWCIECLSSITIEYLNCREEMSHKKLEFLNFIFKRISAYIRFLCIGKFYEKWKSIKLKKI